MTLLTEVMDRPLDPGYLAAARESTPSKRRTSVGVAVLALLLGAVATVSAIQLRGPQPEAVTARRVLEEQITHRQSLLHEAQAEVEELSGQITSKQEAEAANRSSTLAGVIRADIMAAGGVAVSGPGLLVTVTDGREYVLDTDLQRLVNALWAGGAEAIAVNGHRLTPLSAIRTAGSAILVDLEPLISPYRVSAIGDKDAMQVSMARTRISDDLRTLTTQFGIISSVTAQTNLDLPASGNVQLHYARSTTEP